MGTARKINRLQQLGTLSMFRDRGIDLTGDIPEFAKGLKTNGRDIAFFSQELPEFTEKTFTDDAYQMTKNDLAIQIQIPDTGNRNIILPSVVEEDCIGKPYLVRLTTGNNYSDGTVTFTDDVIMIGPIQGGTQLDIVFANVSGIAWCVMLPSNIMALIMYIILSVGIQISATPNENGNLWERVLWCQQQIGT